jgi:hypothetical protein
MGIEILGLRGLKQPFSQVEGDLDLQEILKLFPLLFKKATRKRKVVVGIKD